MFVVWFAPLASASEPTWSVVGVPETAIARPRVYGSEHPVLVHLLLDRATVRPGTTVRLGVYLTMDPGWSIFWQSPGAVGEAVQVHHRVPVNFQVGPLGYPVPRVLDFDGAVSYGYTGSVLLTSDLQVPGDIRGRWVVSADVRVVACQDRLRCVPGAVTLTLPIEVDAHRKPAATNVALFEHFQAELPGPAPRSWVVESTGPGEPVPGKTRFRVTFVVSRRNGRPLPEVGTASFYPIVSNDWSWSVAGHGARVEARDGRWVIDIEGQAYRGNELPEEVVVGGLFSWEGGGRRVRTILQHAVRLAPPEAPGWIAGVTADGIRWAPYDEALLADRTRTVLFAITAKWNLTGQVYDRQVFADRSVLRAVLEHDVLPVRGDYTQQDPALAEWLRRFGRAGVPMYVVFPADPSSAPILLPEVLTAPIVVDALEGASSQGGGSEF